MRDHEKRAAATVIHAAEYERQKIRSYQYPGLRANPGQPEDPPELPDPTQCPRPHRTIYREMLTRYLAATTAAGNALNQHGYISITPSQFTTLELCGVPPEAIRLIRMINGLAVPAGLHDLKDRMQLLASLPPAPDEPGETLDWEAWWLQTESWRNGVRPIMHADEADTLSPAFDRDVLPAIRAAAITAAPSPERIIALIAQLQSPRVSEYYIAVNNILALARGVMADPVDLPNYNRTPESVAANLKKQTGNRQEPPDLRSLPNPDNWSQDGYDPESERIHASEGVIISNRAPYHLFSMLLPSIYGHGEALGPDYLPPVEAIELTEPEAFYAKLSAPRWHSSPQTWQRPNLATAVAQRYGMTPQQVRDPDNTPAAPPSPCDLAGECPTWCGSLQRQGWRASPLTDDGQADSCEFYRFRMQNRNLLAATRAALAEKMIRRIQDRKRPDAPAEVDTGGSQTDKAQPDANRQQSLF